MEDKAKIQAGFNGTKRHEIYSFMVDDFHIGQVCSMFCQKIQFFIKIIIIIIIIMSAKSGGDQAGEGQPADKAAHQSDDVAGHQCDERVSFAPRVTGH